MLARLPFPRLRSLGSSPYSCTNSRLSRDKKQKPKRNSHLRWPLCPGLDRECLVLLLRELDKDHGNWRWGVEGLPLPVSLPGGGGGIDKEMGE